MHILIDQDMSIFFSENTVSCVLILTIPINTLTISYHMYISLLIHSHFQSQISQKLHNHQYYSISIVNQSILLNPQIALQKNQIIKTKKKKEKKLA